jgi:hypothetical protein
VNVIGERRALAWMSASQGSLYVMGFDVSLEEGSTLYTESPEEQALADTENQNYLVRVFTSKTEVLRYKDAIIAIYPKLSLFVEEFPDFEHLWPVLVDMNATYVRTFAIPIRAVLSEMPVDSWPKSIDTVFDIYLLPN